MQMCHKATTKESKISCFACCIQHCLLQHSANSKKIKETENISIVLCFLWLSSGLSLVVLLIIAFYFREQFTTHILLAGLLAGFFVVSLSGTAVRQANLLTKNLGINALRYTTPIFAILWLLLFRDPIFPQIDFLVIGVTAIIIANLLLTFGSKIRTGYKSLILLLWLCGTSAYLLLQNIGFYGNFNLI